MPSVRPCTCLALSLLAASAAAGAQPSHAKRHIAAVRISQPPVIDGDITDAAWKTASRAETFIDRDRTRVADEQTTAWIAYDDTAIYVAFLCEDTQPAAIVGRETVEDSKYQSYDSGHEDNVEVVFDPFLSHRWDDLASFSVNPLGTRSARITGGRGTKAEWKGAWDAAVKRTPDGWTAEMRIPWAILNYAARRDSVPFGINFTRWQERTRIGSVWSDVGPQYWIENEGTWDGVVVPAGAFRRNLSLLSYLLPTVGGHATGLRSGLDARYTVAPDVTAVGSLNPDFATIEGAVEGIAFSRTERYVPERRPFFLEGSDYFQAGSEYGIGRFFYPNRIETFDVGAKTFGKPTPKDTFGVMSTVDYGVRSDLVAKYEHTFSPRSSAGFFLTQMSARSDRNTVGVLTQGSRWGKLSAGTQVALSNGPEAGGGAGQFELDYEDKTSFSMLRYTDVSPIFLDADGLINYTDIRGLNAYHSWGANWRKGWWRGFGMDFFPTYTWHTNGVPFQRGGGFDIGFNNRADWQVGGNVTYSKYDDQTDFNYGFGFTANRSNRHRRWGFGVQTGKVADRAYTYLGPSVTTLLFRHMDVAYSGSVQSLSGIAQQHIVTINYEMSPTRSFGGRLVAQGGDTNWYLSYRNAGAKGTETFVMIGDPNSARFIGKAVVKVVFAL